MCCSLFQRVAVCGGRDPRLFCGDTKPVCGCRRRIWQTKHYDTLWDTATYCNALLQHTGRVRLLFGGARNTLQHTATHCNTLQHTATHCNTPYVSGSFAEEPKIDCNTLQHTGAVRLICRAAHVQRCSQHTATHCNTLQHTATHCNTLQHMLHTRWIRLICRRARNTLQHTWIHWNTPDVSISFVEVSEWECLVAASFISFTFGVCMHCRVVAYRKRGRVTLHWIPHTLARFIFSSSRWVSAYTVARSYTEVQVESRNIEFHISFLYF